MNITSLPCECLISIFEFCSPSSTLFICKYFNDVVSSCEYLWRYWCKHKKWIWNNYQQEKALLKSKRIPWKNQFWISMKVDAFWKGMFTIAISIIIRAIIVVTTSLHHRITTVIIIMSPSSLQSSSLTASIPQTP